MRPNVLLHGVSPRSEPIQANIITVDSKKQPESNEYLIAQKKQKQYKDETPVALRNYKIGWFEFKTALIWPNIVAIVVLHLGTVYTLLTFNFFQHKMLMLWALITVVIGGLGVTGGAHRFWSHRSYKAKLPLRVILLASYLVAGQNSVYNWVRDHRVHHKYSETDADPHNSNRGFFFCHAGWQMMKKHPEVLRRGREIDMSDITSDPLLQFAEKHLVILRLFACFIIPVVIPVYCWNEEWYPTILSQYFLRYPYTLNGTWSVNSLAHFWGYRSYDKSIRPAENHLVAFLAFGEGWHNYHHTFPWDYKVAELGNYALNLTTMIIDGFAKIGWAYDLKTASKDLVGKVVENRGDGSHPAWKKNEK